MAELTFHDVEWFEEPGHPSPRPGSADISTSSPGKAFRDFVETLDLGRIDKHGEFPTTD